MVKWILFSTIVLLNILGIRLIEEIEFDEPYDEEIQEKIRMVPKIYVNNSDNLSDEEKVARQYSFKTKEKLSGIKDIDCLDFSAYAANCTAGAAMFYNSQRVTPPLPSKIYDWCKSIRYLTRCAKDWNSDCSERTDSLFHEDSIKGHSHVLHNICNDQWFIEQYQEITDCVVNASDAWEDCYSIFKVAVEEQKNTTREWTHYETHFYLCCAQAQFRRCTLDFLFKLPKCPYEHAVLMQKFTVIISEADVFQECLAYIVYSYCPNGDPTPTKHQLRMLMNDGEVEVNAVSSYSVNVIVIFLCLSVLVKIFV